MHKQDFPAASRFGGMPVALYGRDLEIINLNQHFWCSTQYTLSQRHLFLYTVCSLNRSLCFFILVVEMLKGIYMDGPNFGSIHDIAVLTALIIHICSLTFGNVNVFPLK